MKRITVILALVMGFTLTAHAQNYKKEGNEYSSKTTQTASESSEEKTQFTWKDGKGNVYPIYIGKSGSCYIKRISAKTGKEYKQYLGKEISADICKQLNRKYNIVK